ncbi:YheC/YheD family protein [Bacillus sp. ISL-35]|uniref:YheC/YheD family endospore coat-associated protein n=1 Tax=Bacillus sp. ISL-35 TaxID=2819122 RepID=UPI001BE84E4B|nr:YheC/YheD family protein [Bacillus sp. ISL-35]MBT2678062.1 YheC/YheD family protein [Bacillus sp. ISL-35]MBT2705723.1 YheC/YheD family protein [Chryseobacterium sp. ISL-80]
MTPAKLEGQSTQPVIALLTEIKEDSGPDFGKVHSFCEELHQGISETGGSFYVFSLKGFSDDGVEGFFYDQDTEEWKKGSLPLPDVIYNRVSSRRTEFSKGFMGFLNKLDTLGIKIFNHRFLSKWEIHEFLMKEEHLQSFIPETHLYTESMLKKMLQLYDVLYIKPVHGSQGRNIIQLVQSDGSINVSLSALPAKDLPPFKQIGELARTIAPIVEKRLCIIQQGVQLSELNGRIMDFRVLCHKNAQQFWKVTSIVARVSAEQYFVSNIARGGEAMKPAQTLALIFGKEQARHQLALMKELALETAETISRHAEGHNAELGIDIGIDIKGSLWLIEANSKPSKNFEERGSKIRPSTKAIIDHCYGLCER